MILNDAGRMVEKWYYDLENKYPDKRCDEMVIMPNHFYCIIENMSKKPAPVAHVGAPLRGRTLMNDVTAWTIKYSTPRLAMSLDGSKQ
ncbi:MAG: hypothetical protein GX361_04560 [Bacteroidales bacterium]|nr:hypothetical protein [Bacteroidales bacterium]